MITDDTDTTTSADGEAAASTTRKRRQPPKRHLPVVPSIDPRLAGPAAGGGLVDVAGRPLTAGAGRG